MQNEIYTINDFYYIKDTLPITPGEVFTAIFENGVIMQWYSPQTWSKVIKTAKLTAENDDVFGMIFAVNNGKRKLIRFLGDIWRI